LVKEVSQPRYSDWGYVYAMLAGIALGIGMFLFGLLSELGNDGAILLYWFGFLLNYIFFRVKDWLQGSSREDFYQNHPQAKLHIKLVFFRAALATGVFVPLYFMMKYAILSGINTAVINSLITGSALFTAILFYFVFDERLSKQHIIGMLFLTGAAALICFSKEKKEVKSTGEVSVIVPVIFALVCCCFYALNSWVNRVVFDLKTIPITRFTSDAFFVYALLLILLSLLWEFYVQSYTWTVVYWGFICSIFNIFGTVMIAKAIGIQKAGPVQAII